MNVLNQITNAIHWVANLQVVVEGDRDQFTWKQRLLWKVDSVACNLLRSLPSLKPPPKSPSTFQTRSGNPSNLVITTAKYLWRVTCLVNEPRVLNHQFEFMELVHSLIIHCSFQDYSLIETHSASIMKARNLCC